MSLTVIFGLPGSGKSYLAERLAKPLGAQNLSTDALRQEQLPPDYSEEGKRKIYAQVFARTAGYLARREAVLLDGTFHLQQHRADAKKLARSFGLEARFIYVWTKELLAKERVSQKRELSDADWAVRWKVSSNFHRVGEDVLSLESTNDNIGQMISESLGYLSKTPSKHRDSMFVMDDAGIEVLSEELGAKHRPAQVMDTHISWVILGEAHAYKIKKPVSFSFLDFRTIGARKFFCENELRLNSRFSPEVYVGVQPIYAAKHGPAFDAKEGDPIDYAVKMKRLDNSLRLEVRLADNEVTAHDVEQLAHEVAAFHRQAKKVDPPKSRASLMEDFTDVLPLVDERTSGRGHHGFARFLETTAQYAEDILEVLGPLLAQRQAEGWVRDVHGDLHAGNIFMYPKPVLFDCIEFNDSFRQIDLLNEIAFLTMELETAGFPALAKAFEQKYFSLMGIGLSDKERSLYRYLKIFRASIGIKIHFLRNLNKTGEAFERGWAKINSYKSLIEQRIQLD